LTNVFTRWNVEKFQSKFVDDLNRFLKLKDFDESYKLPVTSELLPQVTPVCLDKGFIGFLQDLDVTSQKVQAWITGFPPSRE